MKQSGRGQDDAEDEQLTEEINGSANAGVVRGVKRQCLGAGDAEACVDTGAERGRSFLETKWELEATKTRREYPSIYGHSGYAGKADADCDDRQTRDET